MFGFDERDCDATARASVIQVSDEHDASATSLDVDHRPAPRSALVGYLVWVLDRPLARRERRPAPRRWRRCCGRASC